MEDNELWAKITAAFFRKAETPPSEGFVSRVMARVNQLDEPRETPAHWLRWFIPSFGLGFASLLFVTTFASVRADLSAETLLLADNGTEAQWIFSNDTSQNDEVLGYTLEELR
jgi:hypothetical protein